MRRALATLPPIRREPLGFISGAAIALTIARREAIARADSARRLAPPSGPALASSLAALLRGIARLAARLAR